MSAKKLFTVLLAALLVSASAGAAAAAGATATPTETPTEEQTETETETENETETESTNVSVDATYDNGTVTVTVSQNGSAVENATVYANGEEVGATDANGTATFETNATEELEIRVVGDDFEVERTYKIEDGSLVAVEEDETRKGPNENASKTAHGVFAVIQQWLDGGREGNLGQMIQETLDRGKADEKKPDHAKNASENGGKPDDAGNASGENGKPDDAGNSGNSGNSGDHGPSSSDDDTTETETETESDSDSGSQKGNSGKN